MTQEFRSLIRLLLQTTELSVGNVFPVLLLCRLRCVLTFDVVKKQFFFFFLCTHYPKFSVLLFKDGLDVRVENFSCKHSLHIFSPEVNGFTLLTISHLMLKSVFFFFIFQTLSLSVVGCFMFQLEDDLYRLNLVWYSFSVSPI